MSDESLKPPDGLETAGRQLWDSVTATFVLNAGETAILRQAAATADEIALVEAELRSSSLVVAGYAGQPRAESVDQDSAGSPFVVASVG